MLIESEQVWDAARRGLVERAGGRWRPEATRAMMGMSSREWPLYLRDELAVPLSAEEIDEQVVADVERRYRAHLPLIPGAVEAVERLAVHWPLAVASSANRPVIEVVVREAGVADRFAAVVSSEEVARGKPAPDVYLEAAKRLGAEARRCVAIEDSTNGIRSAAAAGMTVIAIPNRSFPPAADALALAAEVLDSIAQLEAATVRRG